MKTDIQIAREANALPIGEVAKKLGVAADVVQPYGKYMAKLDLPELPQKQGKLILVTAINPTPAGEGKTTVAISLADGLRHIGKNSVAALREPSLGPVFGVKGGAAGGGYAQVIPMEEINLHFTGDLHAITAANNLLAAMLDNHIHQGNVLELDPARIPFRRCLDMNDRQLRFIESGLGGPVNGKPRADGFDITAASEVMATLCLAADREDLKKRLGHIVVGYNTSGEAVTADDLHATGAMATLLSRSVQPNLVQTLEGTPALLHGGPFANIAHGCNSVIATKTALALADYTVTEAGFGADLGAEKFLDIKCRMTGLAPDAVVIVATVRALKYHGGAAREDLSQENLEALKTGMANLEGHIRNIREVYQLPAVVALNRFYTDTQAELDAVLDFCQSLGVRAALCEGWETGGTGAVELAQTVVDAAELESNLQFSYPDELPLAEKLHAVATRIYHAKDVEIAPAALEELQRLDKTGCYPVCIAKTQYSFSDDPKLLGRPEGFTLHIRDAKLSAGAGFVVAYAGSIITMPGLPKKPAAEGIDIAADGEISGLF